MKKILILPILLGLCACQEKPIAEFELSAVGCCGHRATVQMYQDYVMMSVDGGELKRLSQVAKDGTFWDYGGTSDWGLEISLNPVYAGIETVALRSSEADGLSRCHCNATAPIKEKELLLQCLEYKVNLELHDGYVMLSVDDGEYRKLPFVKKMSYGTSRYGDDNSDFWIEIDERTDEKDITLRDEYNWGNGCRQMIPIKGMKVSETEKCIAQIDEEISQRPKELVIYQQIRIDNRPNKPMGIRTTYHYVSADDAKQLSPNWDLNDMKRYSLSDGVQDYEHDACDVLKKMRQYKSDKGLKKGLIHIYPDGSPAKATIE